MGYELPAGGPTRRSRRARALLSLTAAGLSVCCVGAAGLGVWNFQHVYRATGPARAAADAFLRDVTSGDATGAYELLCADTRERYSRDEFARQLAVPSVIVEYAIDDVSVATDRGRLRGTATVRLTRRSGVVDRREVPLVHHGDGWRVCGDPF